MKEELKGQRGASMVEFAFVLPLLIVLIFGIIEFGLYLYNQQVITNASREGARAGIVAPIPRLLDTGGSGCTTPPSSIDQVVQCYCASHIVSLGSGSSGPTTTVEIIQPDGTVTGWSSNAPFGDLLRVTVNYTYAFWVIPNFIPGIASLRAMQAIAVMKYE